MSGISELRPRNIAIFERLSYLALVPRGAQVASILAGNAILPALPLNVGVILVFGLLTFLVARRRKNWARWVLLGCLLLLLAGGLATVSGGAPFIVTTSYASLVLPFVALMLQFIAMAFAFTASAAEWLTHERTVT